MEFSMKRARSSSLLIMATVKLLEYSELALSQVVAHDVTI